MYKDKPRLKAVSPNFLQVGLADDFLIVEKKESPKEFGLDPVQELYTPRGS
jgi:hypothetical protein